MIDSKYFFKGFASIKGVGSPAIALGASFIAIGALLKNIGFTIQESLFSTFLTYALPGSLVMAESLIIGSSLINIFIAVWLVNARLYPMTVSLMPLLMHQTQPKWKYYLSCHFIAVSSWLIMKDNYEKRINELETKSTFQEDIIERLSEELRKQQKEIQVLKEEIVIIKKHLELNLIENDIEKPPHY